MQGMGKTLENHGNPCTGHLVPELSYMYYADQQINQLLWTFVLLYNKLAVISDVYMKYFLVT